MLNDIFSAIGFNHEIKSFSLDEFGQADIEIKCNLSNFSDISKFIAQYEQYTNETLKVKIRKKETDKGIYKERVIFRCHHDTRYEGTRDSKSILEKKPTKRFRNTYCPFQMSIKIPKIVEDPQLCCSIVLEHKHNHAVNSLQALSFKSISQETVDSITALFESGMTASQAYAEFLRDLRNNCKSDLEFHLKKADRANCPRRMDFNVLYAKFCVDKFGGSNGPEMFSLLEEKIRVLKEENEGMEIEYKIFDKEESSSLIMTIVTPLMKRVHKMVR